MAQSGEDRVCIWRQRIKRAQEVRDAEKEHVWDVNLASYRGKLKPPTHIWNETDPWVSIELVHSSIRAAIPSLLYQNPQWNVYPKKPEIDPQTGQDASWSKALAKELWLNHVWKETEGNKQVRVAIISAFLAFGAVKVGFAPDFADDELRGEYKLDENGEFIPDGTEDGVQTYVLAKGEYLRDGEGKLIVDEDTGIPLLHPGTLQREAFFVEWVPWENLLFDCEGGNVFRNHRYIIEEWCRPVDQVQNDPRYRSWRRKVQGSETVDTLRKETDLKLSYTTQDSTYADRAVEYDEERVRGWDIYDFEGDRLMVLVDSSSESGDAPQNDQFLMDVPMPEGMEHGPFCFLKWNEDPGKWYPRTDAEAMSKVELEYNLTRSQMLNHRNQSRARYFEVANQGFGSDEGGDLERQKFQNGPSGVLCRVKHPEGVVPARKDSRDQVFFSDVPNIRVDFAEVAGQAGEQRGVASADTATQASILAAGADIRNNDRRDNLVQTFLQEVAAKLLQSASANAEQVSYVKVATAADAPNPFEFKEVNPEDLEGEFDVGVVMGSTQAKNSQNRVMMLERIVTLVAQNPVLGAAPTLMRRLFDALDIRDEQLLTELEAIGKQAVQGLAGQQQGAPGDFGSNNQVLGEIANQYLSGTNAQNGFPTGAQSQ